MTLSRKDLRARFRKRHGNLWHTKPEVKAEYTNLCRLPGRVSRVIAKHTAERHAFDGGKGVCCFVWVNGSIAASANKLDLSGSIYEDLENIPGVSHVKINLD